MVDKRRVAEDGTPSSGRTLWAYGYELMPPHREQGMAALRGLLEGEHGVAEREARTWTARLITEPQVTHVLIVSDSPELDLDIHQKLETELRALGVDFLVTDPVPVGGAVEPEGS
ncbi:MAG: hypothetical protein U5R14_08635 [Gemmatimonadota bacterium]|nr:hypothetical protein [Gemmatimonadota bacterium]